MFDTIRNAWKIADLRKKILFTALILLIFRIGSAIPVPFLDASVMQDWMSNAGDGNLHLYICQDGLKDAVWTDVVERVMERLYAQARELGGEVSGEHGIGHAKRAFLLESAGARQIDLMRGIKAVFDPNGILNPGKVV